MARSQETFNKKEVRNKKEKKRKDKEAKKIARKDNEKSGNLADMLAYVDEFGRISSTPPDPTKKIEVKSENIKVSTPKRELLDEMDTVRKGVVAHFNTAKGYGFIKDLETQESIFVHVNNVIDEIKENNIVNFEVENGPKGPTATKVKIFVAPKPPQEIKKD